MVLEEQPWSRTGILDSFASGAEPDQAEMDLALAEIARRRSAMPTLYPFRSSMRKPECSTEHQDSPVYDFLVLLSFPRAPYRAANEFNTINPMFGLFLFVKDSSTTSASLTHTRLGLDGLFVTAALNRWLRHSLGSRTKWG